MARAPSPAPAKGRPQATVGKASAPARGAKVPPKVAEPAKRSPAAKAPPIKMPSTHPMIGKTLMVSVTANPHTKRKARTFKGKVEHGDATVICIDGSWYLTSSVSFPSP